MDRPLFDSEIDSKIQLNEKCCLSKVSMLESLRDSGLKDSNIKIFLPQIQEVLYRMKVTKENIENQQLLLTIEVEAEKLSQAKPQACKRLAERYTIPGFRKGKAPQNIIEQYVGKQAVLDEMFEIVADAALDEAFETEKLTSITRPRVEPVTLEEGKDLVFKATLTPRPEVELGEYKNLKVEKEVKEITDEDVDHQIEHMAEHQANMVAAPEGSAVEKNDFITLDFQGFIDGEPFKGGEGSDYPLQIGSGSFIPGFEDQLVGAKVDEDVEVKVTFPENYHAKEFAGKPAVFKCKVRSIKKRELPAIDDEFAKKVSKFQTLDELKKDIRENLKSNAERQAESNHRAAIIELATNNSKVEIPNVLIDTQIALMIEEMAVRLQSQGMSLDGYLKFSGMTIEQLRENYRKNATNVVHTDLMLEKVAEVEGIKVTAEEIDREIATMAALYNTTPKQVRKILRDEGRLPGLAAQILHRKVAKFIVDNQAASNVESDSKAGE